MMARKFKGTVATDKIGSECDFEFEVDDDATEADIEHEAREAAFDLIQWNYEEVAKVNS